MKICPKYEQKNYKNSGFTTAADLWGEDEQETAEIYEYKESI